MKIKSIFLILLTLAVATDCCAMKRKRDEQLTDYEMGPPCKKRKLDNQNPDLSAHPTFVAPHNLATVLFYHQPHEQVLQLVDQQEYNINQNYAHRSSRNHAHTALMSAINQVYDHRNNLVFNTKAIQEDNEC